MWSQNCRLCGQARRGHICPFKKKRGLADAGPNIAPLPSESALLDVYKHLVPSTNKESETNDVETQLRYQISEAKKFVQELELQLHQLQQQQLQQHQQSPPKKKKLYVLVYLFVIVIASHSLILLFCLS